MIKVLGLIPGARDATSFYRGLGPWQAIAKSNPNIQFDYVDANAILDWTEIYNYDLFFGQRLYSEDHCTNILSIRKMGKPVWIDYDDNLFEVPEDNPTFKAYMTVQHHKNIKFILNNSDIVTASTSDLCKVLIEQTAYESLRTDMFYVIPNALHDSFPLSLPEQNVKSMRALWRGSITHENDIYQFKKQIINAARDWHFTFFGAKHHFITSEIDKSQYVYVEPKPLIYYFEFLQSRQWGISIVPLVDNNFNRCKSNINWIESTYAGAVTLAPDWPEWQKPGIINYKDADDLEEKLAWIKPGGQDFNYQLSKNYINENLLLSQVNKKRLTILKKLFPNVEN